MATNVDIGETPLADRELASRLKETFSQVAGGVLNKDHFQALNEHRDPFAPRKNVSQANVNIDDQVERWRHHFKTFYRMNPDFSSLSVPKHVAGFDRLIIVPKGLTHRKCVEAMLAIHEVSLYIDDLDGSITVNDRTPKERSYGIWIRDRGEADEELKNKSASTLATEKVCGITSLERLVAGPDYLFEKMCHMDVENVTLCAGSRNSDGGVPRMDWYAACRGVRVDWYDVSYSHPRLRARAVVS